MSYLKSKERINDENDKRRAIVERETSAALTIRKEYFKKINDICMEFVNMAKKIPDLPIAHKYVPRKKRLLFDEGPANELAPYGWCLAWVSTSEWVISGSAWNFAIAFDGVLGWRQRDSIGDDETYRCELKEEHLISDAEIERFASIEGAFSERASRRLEKYCQMLIDAANETLANNQPKRTYFDSVW